MLGQNKRVKIAHIHVWDKSNKGDLGIVESVQDLLRKTFKDGEIIDVPVDQLKFADKNWLNKINDCDLVVIGGGGIYYRYFLPYDFDFIEKIKPPIAILGVGYINEFGSAPLSTDEIQSVIALNNKSALSSVRDNNTYNFLRSNGYTSELSVIGDPAVLLEESQVSIETKGVSVGFNLNYSGWLGFGKHQENILTAYRESMDKLIKNYDAKIFYLVHHPGEYDIIPKLGRDMEIIDMSPKQQKFVYSKLNAVVGMMLHSVVMAFGANTPVVSVAYDIRNVGFMDFIGQGDFLILPENISPEILYSKLKLLLDKNDIYHKKYTEKISDISTSTDEFLKKISSIVPNTH